MNITKGWKQTLFGMLSCAALVWAATADAEQTPRTISKVQIELELPSIDASPYHKPYVAVWIETPERKPIATVEVWADDEQWLKDMRQWWRKLGRKQHKSGTLDALTGATNKPGHYTLNWDGKDHNGNTVVLDKVLVNIEASREEGDRSYVRTALLLSGDKKTVARDGELGKIIISTQ